jgi:hypothetical protein
MGIILLLVGSLEEECITFLCPQKTHKLVLNTFEKYQLSCSKEKTKCTQVNGFRVKEWV